VWERFATAIKIDKIPLFDMSRPGVIGRFRPWRDSTVISFLFLITPAVVLAGGWADT